MRMLQKHQEFLLRNMSDKHKRDLLALDVTPSARWFLEEAEREYWDFKDDFPCVTPPAPLTWIEFAPPPRIVSSERTKEIEGINHIGAMISTYEIDPEDREGFLRGDDLLNVMEKLVNQMGWRPQWVGSVEERRVTASHLAASGSRPRWFSFWYLFVDMPELKDAALVGCYGMYIDEQGQLLPELNLFISNFKVNDVYFDKTADPYADTLPFLFALSLTHCKNVTMNPDPVPLPVQRKRSKKGYPHVEYHILDIKPMQRQVRQQTGDRAKDGESKRALHLVRAHFKTFSPDKPLFGKHTGTYWWALSARGREDQGRIDKEYRVSAK